MIEIIDYDPELNKIGPLPVMLDLETLGTGANSAIISIGACTFDPDTGLIGSTFHGVIDKESCYAVGCSNDISTLNWWESQSKEAKAGSYNHPNPTAVNVVLIAFSDWLNFNSEVWGNGSDFDNAMLAELYRKCNMKLPWKFWNNRCYRTMKNEFPHIELVRHGTHHNAVDDAVTQAKHLMSIYEFKRKLLASV